jgi:hypothetical protein
MLESESMESIKSDSLPRPTTNLLDQTATPKADPRYTQQRPLVSKEQAASVGNPRLVVAVFQDMP